MPFSLLRDRLQVRLETMGIKVSHVYEEVSLHSVTKRYLAHITLYFMRYSGNGVNWTLVERFALTVSKSGLGLRCRIVAL